ncbi:MAG: hypothetical protein NVSMB39_1550 [Candidatus Saccharimonadales bacterium]
MEPTQAPEEVPQNVPEMAFSWEASEFVHHHKSPMWYIILVAAVVLLAGTAIYFHYWLEIGLFLLMGVAIIVYASKPPRTLLYELSVDGIHIDGRLYPFTAFRSFGVSQEPEWHSIDLEPVQRFSPRVVVLYDPEDYEPIIGHLELHLPREDREPDLIEKITRAVRF